MHIGFLTNVICQLYIYDYFIRNLVEITILFTFYVSIWCFANRSTFITAPFLWICIFRPFAIVRTPLVELNTFVCCGCNSFVMQVLNYITVFHDKEFFCTVCVSHTLLFNVSTCVSN